MHRYFPHTPEEIGEMLGRCGLSQLSELYSDVPAGLKLAAPYNLPSELGETEVRSFFNGLGARNKDIKACFAGGGFYDHYVPAAAASLISRSEFLTAYTPYQPEISQGTLQYIFEYQTMMARLTGLDISNASMYDGATATAEAMMMAVASVRKRRRVLVSATLNPAVRSVVDTYARYHGVEIETISERDGVTDLEHLKSLLEEHADVAGVILPTPNYYGVIEDFTGVADMVHARKALLIVNCIAADLATLRTPGEWGADIACGDAQSLGIPLSFGGPYLGFLCATKALMRKMPGRIVGATTDSHGRRAFVLTLQAREQHIRRDKATSNICSNQGLMTLYVSVYMSLLGVAGLREVAYRGHRMAGYLLGKLTATGLCRLKYPAKPFLNEFLLEMDCDVDAFIARAIDEGGILPGIKVGQNGLLVAATEMQTREDADRLAAILATVR
ncbi:MAG: aminomethyl-transferring glycine dehydrogenase subunit GcvPA [Muribaculaceae bacterium]|nr:aminomethyl-transferring glycine dehydrogenase subunit GcvPA [Muribaculaceae bacterium]